MAPILEKAVTKTKAKTAIEYQDIFERREKKYLLTEKQYRALREKLDAFMAVDQYGQTTIMNIYYDTPAYQLIRRSLEKPVYKEKIRLRCYGIPDHDSAAFLELKKKFKGIVYKRRIATTYEDAVAYMEQDKELEEDSQISREIRYFKQFYGSLEPKMVISYDRIAMAGKEDPDLRITFDRNLRWRNRDLDLRHGADGAPLLNEGQVLMEVKIKDALSWDLAIIFSDLGIYSTTFSKYGNAYRTWFEETGRKDLRWMAAPEKAKQKTERTGSWQQGFATA